MKRVFGKIDDTFNIILLFIFSFVFQDTHAQSWLWAKRIGGALTDEYPQCIVIDPSNGDTYTLGWFQGTVDFDPGVGIFNLTAVGGNDISITKLDSTGNFIWAKAMGGTNFDYGKSIGIDPSGTGEIYITGGSWGGDFDPGPGIFQIPGGIFILKLESNGDFVWAKAIGGPPFDGGFSIAVDTVQRQEGYVTHVYITGAFASGTADFDPGPGTFNLTSNGNAIFVLNLDGDGNFEWAKAIGGTIDNGGRAIALDATRSGDVYATGFFHDTVDFDPGPDTFYLSSEDYFGIFILKLDASGSFIWAKAVGGSSYSSGLSIAIDPSGSGAVYTTGIFEDTSDFDPGPDTFLLNTDGSRAMFILKLNLSGDFVWAWAPMDGVGGGFGNAIALDPAGSGDVYTTGWFGGTVDFDPGPDTFNLFASWSGIFISRLDSSGNFIGAVAVDGYSNCDSGSWDGAYSIALDPSGSGSVYVTGYFDSELISFDTTTLTNSGGCVYYYDEEGNEYFCYCSNYPEIFIAKLDGIPAPCTPLVTNTGDSGIGTLRDIIVCASPGATITFDDALTGQTIILTSGEIVINKDLTLSGPGIFDLTISGNNTSRIFHLLSGKNLILEDLSLKNATAVTHGGAIYVNGNLTLENVVLENNFENGIPKGLTLVSPGEVTIHENVEIKD